MFTVSGMKLKQLILLFTYFTLSGCIQSFSQNNTLDKRQRPAPKTHVAAELPQKLVLQFEKDNVEIQRYVSEGNDPAKNFEARLLDLNGDRNPEYEIVTIHPDNSPFCGVSGLCTFWLYRKVGDEWELLLDALGGISALKTLTHGYRDLSCDSWGGASDKYTTIYKFDGRRYQANECLEYKSVLLSNGRSRWKLVHRGPCRN
jgi:hypothetical protein